jgi:hypothetical protein
MTDLEKKIKILINNINLLKILFINYILLTTYNIELNDIINIIIDDIIILYTKLVVKNTNYKKYIELIRNYFNKLIIIIYSSINNITPSINNDFKLINSSFKKELINTYLNYDELTNNINLYSIEKLFDSFINNLYDLCKLI